MNPRLKAVDLGVRDLHGDVGDHIAYFWETDHEFVEAVRFLDVGVAAGDHVVIFGHEEANARVLDVLRRGGCDVDLLRGTGRLSVLGPETTGDLMLESIGRTFQRALDRGATLIRLLGNIGWAKAGWPEELDIIRFEAKVTAAAESLPCIVICMYDVNSVSGSVILNGAFCTHPLTIHNNLIRENPACIAVEDYLEQLDEREEAATD